MRRFFACCDRSLPSSVSLPQTNGKRQRLLTLGMRHDAAREFALPGPKASGAGVSPVGVPGNPVQQGAGEASTQAVALSAGAVGRRGRRRERCRPSKGTMPANTASARSAHVPLGFRTRNAI